MFSEMFKVMALEGVVASYLDTVDFPQSRSRGMVCSAAPGALEGREPLPTDSWCQDTVYTHRPHRPTP